VPKQEKPQEHSVDGHAHEIFKIDVTNVMSNVGDSKRIKGTSGLTPIKGYELDFVSGADMEWKVEMRRVSGGVEIAGSLKGGVELECARCLHAFSFPFDITIREVAIFVSSGYEEVEGPNSEYLVVDGVLDLEPVFRDAICLSLPHKRICAPSCRGICPVCGADLNVETCECASRKIDIRLKPLLQYKENLSTNGSDGKLPGPSE